VPHDLVGAERSCADRPGISRLFDCGSKYVEHDPRSRCGARNLPSGVEHGDGRSPSLFERSRHHGHVFMAEPKIDRLLPLVGQGCESLEPLVGGIQGEAHVLEGER